MLRTNARDFSVIVAILLVVLPYDGFRTEQSIRDRFVDVEITGGPSRFDRGPYSAMQLRQEL